MSETKPQQAMTCERCNTTVALTKDNRDKLKVECGCNERYVRVKKILPGGWDL